MYTAIVAIENNRVAVYMEFPTREEADTHVVAFKDTYPDAFVYEGKYQFDLWVEDGVVTTKPLPPRKVSTLSAAALRKTMLLQGKLQLVEEALAGMSDPTQKQLSQIDWQYSTSYTRDNPNLIALFNAAGMSDTDIDQLFHDAFMSGG